MIRTTTSVPIPPLTTDTTGEKSRATRPDSKPPSSFDEPIKIEVTAETRPRISSGVSSCCSVWRTTTLTLSKSPVRKSIAQESQKLLEKPKTIVASAEARHRQQEVPPARRIGGRCASTIAMQKEPTAGAARSQPSPCSPTARMSRA